MTCYCLLKQVSNCDLSLLDKLVSEGKKMYHFKYLLNHVSEAKSGYFVHPVIKTIALHTQFTTIL